MHLQSIHLHPSQQSLLEACVGERGYFHHEPLIPIAQFERYTFIKSLDFIRYRHKQKPARCAKIIPYLSKPILSEMGMIQSAPHQALKQGSILAILSISGIRV
jgi:hypothetical protein